MSALESIANALSAIIISFVINITVLPLFGLYPSLHDAVWITLIFFAASVLRNFAWRRIFNRGV